MHSSLAQTAHRPWPLPTAPWRWRQSWRKLAFIHYRIDREAIQQRLPAGLRVQTFDGSAWVAIVPFVMVDVMVGSLPSIPPLRRFPELNVRTYVVGHGKPGVWFFSLDADCWPIVLGGRALYGLPYFKSRMTHDAHDGKIAFSSSRKSGGADFRATYQAAAGPLLPADKDSFEHWIAERYCLYSTVRGETIRLDVHHFPWPIQKAEVEIEQSTILSAAGLKVQSGTPICHYSDGVDVVSYLPVHLTQTLASPPEPIPVLAARGAAQSAIAHRKVNP